MSAHSRLSTRISVPSNESTLRARSLLRALLREASYLPDATCRSFVHHRVIARYRTYPPSLQISDDKFESLIHQGYKSLRQLQRANNGELRGLLRVLEHSYGRAGKRRYELMKPLFLEQEPTCSDGAVLPHKDEKPEAYEPPLRLPRAMEQPVRTKRDTLKFRISLRFPLLRSLVYSQSKQGLRFHADRHLKSASFEMPLRNLWQRVQPRKRQSNAAAKWYAETLDKLLPPLPEAEWCRLRQLALGVVPWTGPRRKRPLAHTRHALIDMRNGDPMAALTLYGFDAADTSEAGLAALLEGQMRIGTSKRRWKLSEGRDIGHTITPRLMRHLYSLVLAQCPLMKYDAEKAVWNVIWFDLKRESFQTHGLSPQVETTMSTEDLPQPQTQDLPLLFGNAGVHKIR